MSMKSTDLRIILPAAVEEVLHTLTEHGFEGYIVGGCVRDSLMARIPKDWDITTNAHPSEVIRLFRRTLPTGLQHGTVTVMIGKESVEVTTYRVDGEYKDGRHPSTVEFTPSLEEDLRRRDFTINAMAYAKDRGLTDLFGGYRHLQEKIISCVGNPYERFHEDALRILRAVRFSADLGFTIEEETFHAAKELGERLLFVSKERIFTELTKTICSDHPGEVEKIFALGLEKYLCPSFVHLDIWGLAGFERAAFLPKSKHFRYAALLRCSKSAVAKAILKELKSDNDTISRVLAILSFLQEKLPEDRVELKKSLYTYGEENVSDALQILKLWSDRRQELEWLEKELEDIVKRDEPYLIRHLQINGNDLLFLGIPKGPMVKEILYRLLREVMQHPEVNQKERLTDLAKQYIKAAR